MSSYEARAPLRFVLPIRDMLQSLYGGMVPHNSSEILDIFSGLKQFNEAGPVQIAGVEGHGGALPQYDVLQERYPLATASSITKALDPSIIQRPLIRGPFGVTLNPLHQDDLKWALREIAEAGGAKAGHKVIFKLFEAQNRPVEYLDSLKIINQLRNEGYNVACEVAMVISDKPDLDAKHYEGIARNLLSADLLKKNDIDPLTIVGFSLKDMIGGVKASKPGQDASSINAQNLTLVSMKAIQSFSNSTGQELYLGWHAHEIGNAVDCLSEAGQTFSNHRQNYPAVVEFQQDALMGSPDSSKIKDFGFADLEKLISRHAENGIVEKMSPQQQEIWSGFKTKLYALATKHEYRKSYIDAGKWSKDLLEYGQLASGGLPYVESNGIKPFIKHVAKMETSVGSGSMIGEERAAGILRCLFSSINGLLARDLGNAHSVTPAMKLLNDLTINVISSLLLKQNFIQKHLQSNKDWSQPLHDKSDHSAFREHYGSFRNAQALSYFCTPMPTEVKPDMLGLLRKKLFDYYFPVNFDALQRVTSNNSASMLRNRSEQEYKVIRAALSTRLLDKAGAEALLVENGVEQRVARDFAEMHIGVNSLPVNQGVKSRLSQIESAVTKLIDATGGEFMIRKNLSSKLAAKRSILFSAMLLRPSPGEALPKIVADLARITPFRKYHFEPGGSWLPAPARDVATLACNARVVPKRAP